MSELVFIYLAVLTFTLTFTHLHVTALPHWNNHSQVHRCGDIGGAWINVFLSPSYPREDQGPGSCVLRLLVASPSVCQFRVDIVDAAFVPPRNGQCQEQRLEVSGDIVAPSVIQYCGTDINQHFYVHLVQPLGTAAERWVDFSVTASTDAFQYRYKLWITQVDCSSTSPLEAPRGCLQYFVGHTGVIKSFDYGESQYLDDHTYQACVKAEPGACSITLSADQGYFGVQQPRDRAGVGLWACTKDYLFLPGTSTAAAGESGQRFCGGRLSYVQGDTSNRPVTARLTSPLYVLTIKSSNPGQKGGSSLGQGFKLTFLQSHSCTDPSSLSPPQGSALPAVRDEPSSTLLHLPHGHEIEIPSRNVSIFPPSLLPIISHSHVDVFPSSPFGSVRNHHQMSFHKRNGFVLQDTKLKGENKSEQQDEQQQLKQQHQQQQQQPKSKKVREGEKDREKIGNGLSPEPPPKENHYLKRVSNIISSTLREVFPELGH